MEHIKAAVGASSGTSFGSCFRHATTALVLLRKKED